MVMIQFLTMAEVLQILEDQIRNYGGIYGVRDLNLLTSAIYMPQTSVQGLYLHKTIPVWQQPMRIIFVKITRLLTVTNGWRLLLH
jgi:hypothetical protein